VGVKSVLFEKSGTMYYFVNWTHACLCTFEEEAALVSRIEEIIIADMPFQVGGKFSGRPCMRCGV
jgi:hypothetical protein